MGTHAVEGEVRKDIIKAISQLQKGGSVTYHPNKGIGTNRQIVTIPEA